MRVFALSLSLFWRTIVLYLLLAVSTLLVFLILSIFGIAPHPDQLPATATYIRAKPTLIYAAFALVLFTSEYGLHTNLHSLLWGHRLQLAKNAWRAVVVWLGLLLVALATLNAIVAALASVDTWVTYKLFGAVSILAAGHLAIASHVLRTFSNEA